VSVNCHTTTATTAIKLAKVHRFLSLADSGQANMLQGCERHLRWTRWQLYHQFGNGGASGWYVGRIICMPHASCLPRGLPVVVLPLECPHVKPMLENVQILFFCGRHLGFRFRGHNFWTAWARHFKFGTVLETHRGNMAKSPKLTKIKIQDGRRPPSWISV